MGTSNSKHGSVFKRVDWRLDLVGVSVVYFVEGILDMASLAVNYYLKDTLGLGPAASGFFMAASQLPWELTPILGLITDTYPLLGYRRRGYLLVVGIAGAVCWWALVAVTRSWVVAGWLVVGSSACTAWTQVIADAVLVRMSQGHEQDVASFYQALSWVTYTTGATLSAYTTGKLLELMGPNPVFILAGAGLMLDALCAGFLSEDDGPSWQRQEAAAAAGQPAGAAAGTALVAGAVGLRVSDPGVVVAMPIVADKPPAIVVAGVEEEAGANGVNGEQRQQLLASPGARSCSGADPDGPLPPDARRSSGGGGSGSGTPGASPSLETGGWLTHLASAAAATATAVAGGSGGGAAGEDELRVPLLQGLQRVDENAALAVDVREFPAAGRPNGADRSPRPAQGQAPPRRTSAAASVGAPSVGGKVAQLVSQVYTTLKDPHILVPALFIFFWQASPSPTSAMFYFQTEVLHFSPGFQELVYLCGSLAGFSGVLLYNWLLVDSSLKTMLLWCALLGSALNATQLLLVSRLNVKLGISDKLFVAGDYAMLSTIAEVMMTPMLALSARVCPPGAEATLYACLYSILNLSTALSAALGALLTRWLGVSATNFSNLLLLVGICNASMLLPLPLLSWLPKELEPPGVFAEEAEEEAATAAVAEAEGAVAEGEAAGQAGAAAVGHAQPAVLLPAGSGAVAGHPAAAAATAGDPMSLTLERYLAAPSEGVDELAAHAERHADEDAAEPAAARSGAPEGHAAPLPQTGDVAIAIGSRAQVSAFAAPAAQQQQLPQPPAHLLQPGWGWGTLRLGRRTSAPLASAGGAPAASTLTSHLSFHSLGGAAAGGAARRGGGIASAAPSAGGPPSVSWDRDSSLGRGGATGSSGRYTAAGRLATPGALESALVALRPAHPPAMSALSGAVGRGIGVSPFARMARRRSTIRLLLMGQQQQQQASGGLAGTRQGSGVSSRGGLVTPQVAGSAVSTDGVSTGWGGRPSDT